MKNFFSIVLCFVMLISFGVSTAKAQTSSNEEADFYISSARELNEFATKVNNGNDYSGKIIKLTNDIVFESSTVNNFVPIAYSSRCPFNGVFDGAGYTIRGIDITSTDSKYDYIGLLGFIGTTGIIKNLKFMESSLTTKSTNYIAAIVGFNEGIVDNCQSQIQIIAEQNEDKLYVGGIAAMSTGTIKNCSTYNSITAVITNAQQGRYGGYYLGARVGGIVGENSNLISNCSNSGNISFSTTDNYDYYCYIGGIVGYSGNNKSIVQNCYSIGLITGNVHNAGIVGYIEGIISNCFSSIESAPQNIYEIAKSGIEKNNKALSSSEMKLSSFTDILNTNRGSNSSWLPWVSTSESEYPTIIKTNEVTFKPLKYCTIKTDIDYAYEGQTVTLTATTDKNYKVKNINIATLSGTPISVTNSNGKYQFTMPSDKVIVSADLIHSNAVSIKSVKYGKITSNLSTAFEKQTVILTPVANKGYKISKVTVTTTNGKKVVVTKKNGKYQFKMPSEKVIVSATFSKK